MKKIMIIVVAIAIISAFYPKPYISSPGFISQEDFASFEQNKPKCLGYSYLKNPEGIAADAPGESLCFGLLIK